MARETFDGSLATGMTLRQVVDAFIVDPTGAGLAATRLP